MVGVEVNRLGKNSQILGWTLVTIIAANLAMLIFYNLVTYRLYFHSDAATINLLAAEIQRSGDFFPRDWNYVNGDFFVIFGHLFILPFLPFLKNNYLLHALSSMISGGLVLASVWFLLKELGASLTARLFALALLTTGLSPYMAENLYGQVSYGALFYVAAFQLYFLNRYLRSCRGGVRMVSFPLVAMAILIYLVFLSNPVRGMATYGLPLLAGLFFVALRGALWTTQRLPRPTRQGLLVVAATVLVAALLGSWAHQLVLAKVCNVAGAADARYLPFEEIGHHLLGGLRGWLFVLGGLLTAGRSVLSVAGLNEAFRLLLALGLLALPIFLFIKVGAEKSSSWTLTTVFTLTGLAVVSFFHFFTTVPDMTSVIAEETTSRYFVVSILFLLILLVLYLDRWLHTKNFQAAYPLLLLPLVPFLAAGYAIFVQPGFAGVGVGVLKENALAGVVEFLEANHLEYGYATYWYANATTVLSGGRTTVRPVEMGVPPQPMRWLNANGWYHSAAHQGPTFILLTDNEYQLVKWDKIAGYLGQPARELATPGFHVVEYSFNIASRLPGWDDMLTTPYRIAMLPTTLHQIGKLEETATGSWLAAAAGESGYLTYGPYLTLSPGKYEAVFELRTALAEGTLGTMDVVRNKKDVLASQVLPHCTDWQKVAVPFEVLKKNEQFEFRVHSTGLVPVSVQAITVGGAHG